MNMQSSMNSFFKFVLGFTTFISVSLGLTYAVTTYAVAKEKERQTAAALQTFLGKDKEERGWWAARMR